MLEHTRVPTRVSVLSTLVPTHVVGNGKGVMVWDYWTIELLLVIGVADSRVSIQGFLSSFFPSHSISLYLLKDLPTLYTPSILSPFMFYFMLYVYLSKIIPIYLQESLNLLHM